MSNQHFTIYSSMEDDFRSVGENALAYKVSSHMLLFSQLTRLRKFQISHSKEGGIIRFDIYPDGPYEEQIVAELCKIYLDLTDNTSYDGEFDVPKNVFQDGFSIFELFEETDKYLDYIDLDPVLPGYISDDKLKIKMLQMLDVFFGDMDDYPYSNFLNGLRIDTIDYITSYLNFHTSTNKHEKEFSLYNNRDFAVSWAILKVQIGLENYGPVHSNSSFRKLADILGNFSVGVIYGGFVVSKLADIYGSATLIEKFISQDLYYYQFLLSVIKNKLINIFDNDHTMIGLFIDILFEYCSSLVNNYFDRCVLESITMDFKSNL